MSLATHSDMATVLDLTTIAASIGQGSELLETGRLCRKRPDNVLGLLLRVLSKEEIAVMEDRGCRADDWSLIQVAEDFNPFRVRRTHFVGHCVLGRADGEIEVLPGMHLGTGIYDCTLVDCQIGANCLLEKVRFAARIAVESGSVLFDIGTITSSAAPKQPPATRFGCGHHLRLAVETGGRELPVWAEVDVPQAAVIVRSRADRSGQTAVQLAVANYVANLPHGLGWVRRGARLRHTERIENAWIGAGAVIDHALELSNVAILSTAEEPTTVSGGAMLAEAVVQWGVQVGGHAIVRRSVLVEHSAVDENGVVGDSVIGPNTAIAKGEVTSSLVGPFVGFHHQSLLIAACWPEGRGNVAYGAMVGSNHTGRAPDQEVWPGEGTFFGLGCAVRFPSDFSQAPYTVIAAGTAMLAQKVTLPFSLITTPAEAVPDAGIPRAYNEILPGWGLYANAYGLERMEMKWAARDQARRQKISYHVLRPEIITELRRALALLEEASRDLRGHFLDDLIPGIGKNFLRRSALLDAIAAYRRTLVRYALRILLGEAEGKVTIAGSAEIAHAILDQHLPGRSRTERFRELITIERENAAIVERSKATDDERGARIIPGYADAHPQASADAVVAHARQRVVSTEARVRALEG